MTREHLTRWREMTAGVSRFICCSSQINFLNTLNQRCARNLITVPAHPVWCCHARDVDGVLHVVVQFICFLETTVFNQQLHRSSAVLCRSDGFVQHVSGHARPLTETIFIPGANPDLNATRFRLTSITVPSSFNEDFPSLLVATAGVFSAGVVCEKMRARHQLRLILKDGIALRQCIEVYGYKKG